MCLKVTESCMKPSGAAGLRDGLPTILEQLLALGRAKYSELLSVLRYGAAGDVNGLVAQELHDLLIRERMARIFGRNQLLDLGLDRLRRQLVVVGGEANSRV